MGIIDIANLPLRSGSAYPEPYAREIGDRSSVSLGDAGGLTQFGVRLVTLGPDAKSSLRHWHVNEDEFVMVTRGELVLVQDAGESVMRAGDCAAFPAGRPDGHHLINRSGVAAQFLVVGTRLKNETAYYSDIDMMVTMQDGDLRFTRKDGAPLTGDAE